MKSVGHFMFVPAKGVILVKINVIGLSGHARVINTKPRGGGNATVEVRLRQSNCLTDGEKRALIFEKFLAD